MPDRVRPDQPANAPNALNVAGLSLVAAVIVIILSVVLQGFNAPGPVQPQATTPSKG
jgi:hypothetical protein